MNGSSSGGMTTKVPATFTSFNWNYPSAAGTSGQFLTSQGGGSNIMTWTTPTVYVSSVTATSPLASSGGLTPVISISSSTGSGAIVLATSPTITTPSITGSTSSFSGGVLNITNTNTAPLISQTLLAPNMATTNDIFSVIGKASTNGNALTLSYNWTGSSNNANFVSLGHYGGSASGLVMTFGGTTTLTGTSSISLNGPVISSGNISATTTFKSGANTVYTGNEGVTHGFEIYSSGLNNTTNACLYMGADGTNNVSYIQSAKSGTSLPLYLNMKDSNFVRMKSLVAQDFGLANYFGITQAEIGGGNGGVNFGPNTVNGNQWCTFYINSVGYAAIGSIFANVGGGTTFSTTSDYRLKSDIIPGFSCLDKVDSLNCITYQHIYAEPGQRAYGFLAHEVQAIFPSVITGEKDGIDINGDPIYQQIDHQLMVPYLVKAIQELSAKVSILESQLLSV